MSGTFNEIPLRNITSLETIESSPGFQQMTFRINMQRRAFLFGCGSDSSVQIGSGRDPGSSANNPYLLKSPDVES